MLEMILYVLVGNWKKPRSRPNCVKESLTQFKVEVQFPVVKKARLCAISLVGKFSDI